MGRKFDAKTQTWIDVPENNSTTVTEYTGNNETASTPYNPVPESQPKVVKEDGKSKDANKEFAEAELTYLTGDAVVEPNSVTLATQAGKTVEMRNLGKYLSGRYYVTEVKIDITASGTSLTYSVLKNGFGKTLKPYVPVAETSQQEDVPIAVETSISAGDKVKFIEDADATYSNAHEGVKVPQWVRKKTHTVDKVTDDGQRARLKEIWSWTYTKYLQKV